MKNSLVLLFLFCGLSYLWSTDGGGTPSGYNEIIVVNNSPYDNIYELSFFCQGDDFDTGNNSCQSYKYFKSTNKIHIYIPKSSFLLKKNQRLFLDSLRKRYYYTVFSYDAGWFDDMGFPSVPRVAPFQSEYQVYVKGTSLMYKDDSGKYFLLDLHTLFKDLKHQVFSFHPAARIYHDWILNSWNRTLHFIQLIHDDQEISIRLDISVLTHKKTPAQSYNSIGYRLYKKSKIKEASQFFRAAIQLDPEHKYAYYNLACMRALLKDREGAEQALHQYNNHVWSKTGKPHSVLIQKIKNDKDFKAIIDDKDFNKFLEGSWQHE